MAREHGQEHGEHGHVNTGSMYRALYRGDSDTKTLQRGRWPPARGVQRCNAFAESFTPRSCGICLFNTFSH